MKTFSAAQAKELASMAKALGEANRREWDRLLGEVIDCLFPQVTAEASRPVYEV